MHYTCGTLVQLESLTRLNPCGDLRLHPQTPAKYQGGNPPSSTNLGKYCAGWSSPPRTWLHLCHKAGERRHRLERCCQQRGHDFDSWGVTEWHAPLQKFQHGLSKPCEVSCLCVFRGWWYGFVTTKATRLHGSWQEP